MAVERTDDNETGGTGRAATTADGPGAKVADQAPTAPGAVASEEADPKIAAAVAAAEAAGPQSGETVRIDSWIWSVRLAKTRSAGATACRGGHVRVNGERVKPAHSLRVGDEVRVRQEGWERVVIVKRLIRKRVGAPVAAQCYVDNSPPPPPRVAVAPAGIRDRGAGRPTKRDRRELERLRGLAEGNRRGRFAGPSGPGGADSSPDGSDAPEGAGGSGAQARRSERTRRSDRGGNADRTGRSR
ncbi:MULTISPECIES: RNA-binding S4 domain-containing protein [Streptomyces]|uniref:RNA-binding S4 domain-containing protein n=1 Tax=Streptomyces TaxID=1883 RepID=UPI00018528BA|nr:MULTISPECIES: RNA-binding S4 domain-containing protein [Streptomyces]MYT05127.1 RNA-binding S4 domain-containing protein [Streptomyces sp. SID5470]